MNTDPYREQAKGSLPEQTNGFKCPYCKEGWMWLKENIFTCNRCKNRISREEGIKKVVENIKKIQEEDRFGTKTRVAKK